MKRIFSRTVRIIIIILFVMASSSYVHIIENKTYSSNTNKSINLSSMALKLEELIENDIYSAKDTYTGDLTGYVYNCPLCTGQLACKWKYDVTDGKTTYPDETYGEVRIVASSRNLPCGTIIRFNSNRVSSKPTLAIVLDRGMIGFEHKFMFDLLVENEEISYQLGVVYNAKIDVLRYGY